MKNFVCRGTSLMLALVMLLLLLPLGATAPVAAFEDVLPAEGETAQETQASELAEVGSVNEFSQTITDEDEEPSEEEPMEEEPSVPMIKTFTNTSTGTLITWDAMEGAVKYRVYYINDKGLWQGLGNTTTTSFTHNNLTPGTTYTYTLRILDQNNVAVSDFYKDGFKNTFYASPGITSLTNTASGVQVKWASVGGVDTYRVYKSTNEGTFVSVADVKGNSYMDAEVASGNKYTYSVCCLGDDLSVISGLNQGSSITYFEAPVITSAYNTIDGTKISWLKVNGAVKYRVYYINDKGLWQGIGNTTSTEYTHSGLKDGKTYTYTVRVLNYSGTAVSDFDRQGVANTYLAPVVVSSLGNTTEGVKVTWGAVDGISTYRLFKKTNGSAWVKVTDVTGTSYTDKDVSSGNKYTYTLRCIGPEGFVSHHNQGKSITFFEAPVIASVSSTATGNKISWSAVNGAVKYRVYYINDKGLWQGLGNTTATSYEHKNLTAGKTYTYTVRVLNYSGTAVSDFDRQGTSAVFYMPPVISSLSNTANGVSVTWDGINGVSTYRLYRRTNGSSWVHIGDVNGTSYVDTNVSSGNQYTYTTRCMNSQGKLVSTHNQGKSITFYGAPVIQKIVNDNNSATITWGAVNGAAKYRVYYVNALGKWEGLGNTTTTSYRHQNLKDGTTYTYTVRVLNTSGTAVSDFDRVGTSTTFFNPPEITAVTKVGTGYMVQWDAREGVAGYRLFRRSVGSSWETVIANTTSTFYIDASTKSDVVYTYTIRYIDSKGNYISGYLNETKYYYNGELANGTINVNGTDCYFNNGLFRSGYQKIGGNDYYYGANGAIMKNGIVGSDKDGWRYADSTGKIDYTCCNGVTQHGYKWIVINGMARKVVTDSDLTLFYAAKEVAKVTKPTMTKQQKLKACFDYCKVAYAEFNPRIPHYKGMDWPIVYANDMFVGSGGNCLSYGAAFAYMAKAIGYTEVYACHSGGHGWAEIDGLIYDPEWSKHRFYHSYFALSYDEIYDQNYKGAIAAGLPWMHVKI